MQERGSLPEIAFVGLPDRPRDLADTSLPAVALPTASSPRAAAPAAIAGLFGPEPMVFIDPEDGLAGGCGCDSCACAGTKSVLDIGLPEAKQWFGSTAKKTKKDSPQTVPSSAVRPPYSLVPSALKNGTGAPSLSQPRFDSYVATKDNVIRGAALTSSPQHDALATMGLERKTAVSTPSRLLTTMQAPSDETIASLMLSRTGGPATAVRRAASSLSAPHTISSVKLPSSVALHKMQLEQLAKLGPVQQKALADYAAWQQLGQLSDVQRQQLVQYGESLASRRLQTRTDFASGFKLATSTELSEMLSQVHAPARVQARSGGVGEHRPAEWWKDVSFSDIALHNASLPRPGVDVRPGAATHLPEWWKNVVAGDLVEKAITSLSLHELEQCASLQQQEATLSQQIADKQKFLDSLTNSVEIDSAITSWGMRGEKAVHIHLDFERTIAETELDIGKLEAQLEDVQTQAAECPPVPWYMSSCASVGKDLQPLDDFFPDVPYTTEKTWGARDTHYETEPCPYFWCEGTPRPANPSVNNPLIVIRDNPRYTGKIRLRAGEWMNSDPIYRYGWGDGYGPPIAALPAPVATVLHVCGMYSTDEILPVWMDKSNGSILPWIVGAPPLLPPPIPRDQDLSLPIENVEGPGLLDWEVRGTRLRHGVVYSAWPYLQRFDGSGAVSETIGSKQEVLLRLSDQVLLVPVIVVAWYNPSVAGSIGVPEPDLIEQAQQNARDWRDLIDHIPDTDRRNSDSWPEKRQWPPDDIWDVCGIQFQVVGTVVLRSFSIPDSHVCDVYYPAFEPFADGNGSSTWDDIRSFVYEQFDLQKAEALRNLRPIIVHVGPDRCEFSSHWHRGKTVEDQVTINTYTLEGGRIEAGENPALVTAHELGHALGLAHSTDADENLMMPSSPIETILDYECRAARENAQALSDRYREYMPTGYAFELRVCCDAGAGPIYMPEVLCPEGKHRPGACPGPVPLMVPEYSTIT